jgi:hypothetical protein
MYCSICGAHVPHGKSECAVCGERVIRMPNASVARRTRGVMVPAEEAVGLCPRCGFNGPGYGYFNRGANIAKLVAATVVTGGLMGMGGLAYWLLRKDHRICPACGLKWGPYGERAVALAQGGSAPVAAPAGSRGAGVSPWMENKMRKRSIALFIFAALLMIAGVGNGELVPILMSVFAAGGGYFLHRDAETKRQERREALIAGLQPEVLRLAAQRRGRLTVTEVASSLGWALPRAEKVLNSLDDGLRVRSEVTDEGVIVYEFPEVMFATARLTDPTNGAAMA